LYLKKRKKIKQKEYIVRKEEIELKLIKELEDKKIFIRSLEEDYEKADKKESAVNVFLFSNTSIAVKIYTEQLLGREMSWKTFKEYMLSNIENIDMMAIITILLDEKIKEVYKELK
jgi:hypothetical protein